MSDRIEFVRGGAESLDEVRELWAMVRGHLSSKSVHFGEEMRALDWPRRKVELFKGEGTRVMVDQVLLAGSGEKIAYCVSTVTAGGEGEVDSLFVVEGHRGEGIGHELMERALGWMEEEGAKSIKLVVTYGNEEVLPFYERHSFYPRRVILERKREGKDPPR